MQTRQNKGFTLLEILLVIAAIGILASIVIVAINPLRQLSKAENAARWSNINTIQKALDQYYIANGKYPDGVPNGSYEEVCDTGDETVGEGTIDCVTEGKLDLRALVPTYIAEIPRDPNGGGYKVGINPTNNSISVWTDKAKLGELVAINPMELTLVIGGTNEVGQELSIDLVVNSLENIDPNNIIWYTVTGGVETQVGTGASYTVQSGDVGSEITAKVVLGGTNFASGSGGTTTPPIVLTAGDKDQAFDTGVPVGFNNQVYTTAIQSDGKVIVGGWFTSYQGVSANYIVRLNSDGSRDTSFNVGTGFNNWVYTTAIQSDGKVIVGGGFTSYKDESAGYLIRIQN